MILKTAKGRRRGRDRGNWGEEGVPPVFLKNSKSGEERKGQRELGRGEERREFPQCSCGLQRCKFGVK